MPAFDEYLVFMIQNRINNIIKEIDDTSAGDRSVIDRNRRINAVLTASMNYCVSVIRDTHEGGEDE